MVSADIDLVQHRCIVQLLPASEASHEDDPFRPGSLSCHGFRTTVCLVVTTTGNPGAFDELPSEKFLRKMLRRLVFFWMCAMFGFLWAFWGFCSVRRSIGWLSDLRADRVSNCDIIVIECAGFGVFV